MAQTPASSGTATKSLISQAIAELHLGRLPEAEAALQQASNQIPRDTEVVANTVVLKTIMGKREEAGEWMGKLESSNLEHGLLMDLREKGVAFDMAAAKYSAKVAS